LGKLVNSPALLSEVEYYNIGTLSKTHMAVGISDKFRIGLNYVIFIASETHLRLYFYCNLGSEVTHVS